MRQSLELNLTQRLTMTPQLQQAIRLLQLSAVELKAEIQQALESNPMLEELDEGGGEDAEEAERPEAGDGIEDEGIPEPLDVSLNRSEPSESSTVEEDWDETYESVPAGGPAREPVDPGAAIEARASTPQTLREHLYWQMTLTPLGGTDRRIAEALIDAINDDGYLTCTLEEIRQALAPALEVELDEIEAVLHQIQNFDPLGVGARDLAECLSLQLRALDPATPGLAAARELVAKHLQLLASRDHAQLRRAMRLKPEALREAVALIRSLNPRPGAAVESGRPAYVIPDLIVRRQNGRWRVELNTDAFPRLTVNRRYEALVRNRHSHSDGRYLQTQLKEARWFIKSLHNRHQTLLKVGRAIVERQLAFFEHGEEAMKPMVLHDIAEALGMHESTISRVTANKYMLTPRGIFELKYFFSSHVSTADGGVASATAIRSLIRKFIEAEPPDKPVSDSQIVELLQAHGVRVARRTIAKYREHMNIPPSNQRKSLA